MALTELYVSSAGGGAHNGTTPADAFSWAEMVTDINAGGKAGNRYNVLQGAGISRTTTTDTISGSGTITSPVIIRGYASTIGDAYLGRTNQNGPLITTNMPAVTYTTGSLILSGSFLILETINLSAANASRSLDLTGNNNIVKSCAVVCSGTNAASNPLRLNGTNCHQLDCDATFTGASGGVAALVLTGANAKSYGGRFKGGVTVGVTIASTSIISRATVYGSTIGISATATSGTVAIWDSTIVGNTSDGINIVTGTTSVQDIQGCCITDNGGYGINGVSASNGFLNAYNRLRDNTSGPINLATDYVSATSYGQVTTDTGGPETDYVNSPGNDYRLIPTSPATSAALPASASMGALQRVQNAPIAGAIVVGSSVGRASRI